MTKGERFNKKAAEITPDYSVELTVEDSIDDYDFINDEISIFKGEYLGGMATVIIALLKKEDKKPIGPVF